MTIRRKKLIEIALPLDQINDSARKENNVHTGLPSNLHTWWSRKPIGVARAIIFASLVDDPSEYLPAEEAFQKRERLFSITAALADIDNSDDELLLEQAKSEILKSNAGSMPHFWDPFCGGGALPLEALRLGLPTTASDLNPVSVFITRVLVAMAPRFAHHPPINPTDRQNFLMGGAKFEGLKRDIEAYAEIVHRNLHRKIGDKYPDVKLPKDEGGGRAPIVAWIWARTVECPNPSCRAHTILANKFWLSTHSKNKAHVIPEYQKKSRTFTFSVKRSGEPIPGTVTRNGAQCLACSNPITFAHIRAEGIASRIGYTLMALAVEGPSGRVYMEPTTEQTQAAENCTPEWEPDTELPDSALGFRVQKYGISKHRDLFTPRQLTMLSDLAAAIRDVRETILQDAADDIDYANLIQSFLGLSLSRVAQTNNTLVRWLVRASGTSKGTPAFDRPIVSMSWEFSEGNIFGTSVGSWKAAVRNPLTALNSVPSSQTPAIAIQHDAADDWKAATPQVVVSTDPPYYDAIGYSDLSDFFYIWLRRSLALVHPDLFGTMLVPKGGDLTRNLGQRSIDKKTASDDFLDKLHRAFKSIYKATADDVPVSVYYAFKQSEVDVDDEGESTGSTSTGWETLLEGLINSGFQITGTWPLHTEATTRLR